MNPDAAYRRYFPLVRQRCRRLLGDVQLASDVAQDTFVRFIGARVSGPDERIIRWLYVCSGNLAIDQLRKRRQSVGVEDLRAPLESSNAETTSVVRSLIATLGERVGPELMLAALLTHVDGLSQTELAATFDVTERTVRRWLTSVDEALAQLETEVKS